ncbi:MAG TPA: hypothetical protein VFP13_06030 [Actinomycetota bacterium]|nr:hypothetical protein [Actinomycetota bacterium]
MGKAEDEADRALYGIDGPRRRPRPQVPQRALATAATTAEARPVIVLPEAEDPPARGASVPPRAEPAHGTVRDRWREESADRAREATIPRPATLARRDPVPEPVDLEARFDALRVVLATELGRRIDAAVARIEGAFDREIEALRTANREEAKRLRSANGEAFVRIRAADTQELERIRRSVDEGIERLCTLLEGQLDRVWGANDVELERIRSAGADRLAEVHDLLTEQLGRLRSEQASAPVPQPRRRWSRRVRSGSTG